MINMKNFESLVSIWNEQITSPSIDYREVIDRYKKTRNKFSIKIWIELSIMVAVMGIIAWLWLNIPFKMWTTQLALGIFELCCLYYVIVQFYNLRALSHDSLLEKPEKYIAHIRSFRRARYIQNTRNFLIYTLTMGVGFVFYFVEFFIKVNIWVVLGSFTMSSIWFLICYFILRKAYIKKEEKSFNEMLVELERLKNQFSNP